MMLKRTSPVSVCQLSWRGETACPITSMSSCVVCVSVFAPRPSRSCLVEDQARQGGPRCHGHRRAVQVRGSIIMSVPRLASERAPLTPPCPPHGSAQRSALSPLEEAKRKARKEIADRTQERVTRGKKSG